MVLIRSIRHLWRWTELEITSLVIVSLVASLITFSNSSFRKMRPGHKVHSAFQKSHLISFSGFFPRVINAGKSTHNEDQASCEVLSVKKKAGAITSTPNRNSKRRSSLPNGEGLQLKENAVRSPVLDFQEKGLMPMYCGPTVRHYASSKNGNGKFIVPELAGSWGLC